MTTTDKDLAAGLVALARVAEVALDETALTMTQYRLLTFLVANPSVPTDLAFRFALRKQSVSRLITGLVTRGLVERRADPNDGRRVNPVVTPAGQKLLRTANKDLRAHLDGLSVYLEDSNIDFARSYESLCELGAAVQQGWRQYIEAGDERVPVPRRAPRH